MMQDQIRNNANQPLYRPNSLGNEKPLIDKGFESGDEGTRTPDILLAKQALYQLSYVPVSAPPHSSEALANLHKDSSRTAGIKAGRRGGIAQLVEHHAGSVRVRSSSLLASTKKRSYSRAFFFFSSEDVVGWAMATHIRAELVVDALNMAIHNRKPKNVIHYFRPRVRSTRR